MMRFSKVFVSAILAFSTISWVPAYAEEQPEDVPAEEAETELPPEEETAETEVIEEEDETAEEAAELEKAAREGKEELIIRNHQAVMEKYQSISDIISRIVTGTENTEENNDSVLEFYPDE